MIQQCSIQGHLSFKVYRGDGTLRYETGPIKNFITPTGLSYTQQFAFADCFRYFSIGFSSGRNFITGNSAIPGYGTTGLSAPSPFMYIGGRNVYYDTDGSTSQYDLASCYNTETASGVSLSRGWRIPTGTGVFEQDYAFREFMVSPGQPYVTGYATSDFGSGPASGCACNSVGDNTYVYYYDPVDGWLSKQGNENSNLYSIYPNICNATKAFARIVAGVTGFQGDFIIANYTLNLTYVTGVQMFAISGNATGTNWGGFNTGYINLLHHGVKLINDGSVSTVGSPDGIYGITQPFDISVEKGESYIGPWGMPIEAINLAPDNFSAYLTNDNIEYAVNQFSGGSLPTGISNSSGVKAWMSYPSQHINEGDGVHYNIRRTSSDNNYAPVSGGYYYDTNVTADSLGYSVITHASDTASHFPIFPSLPSGRIRQHQYNMEFWGPNANSDSFAGEYIRAMVLNYKDIYSPNYYPFLDVTFFDKDGHAIVARNASRQYTYNNFTTYNIIESIGKINMSFVVTVSSPCDSSVLGC